MKVGRREGTRGTVKKKKPKGGSDHKSLFRQVFKGDQNRWWGQGGSRGKVAFGKKEWAL